VIWGQVTAPNHTDYVIPSRSRNGTARVFEAGASMDGNTESLFGLVIAQTEVFAQRFTERKADLIGDLAQCHPSSTGKIS